VQVKPVTDPFEVAGSNVQLAERTSVSQRPKGPSVPAVWSCHSWRVADVKLTSVIVSVQLAFGQPGEPGIGDVGAAVDVVTVTFPFLTSPAGTGVDPTTVTGAGFWPGDSFDPDGVVHVEAVSPAAVRTWRLSKFPSPA
jgi:hypothetical protein